MCGDDQTDEWVLEWLNERFPPGIDRVFWLGLLGDLNGMRPASRRRWIRRDYAAGPRAWRITRRGRAVLNAYRAAKH